MPTIRIGNKYLSCAVQGYNFDLKLVQLLVYFNPKTRIPYNSSRNVYERPFAHARISKSSQLFDEIRKSSLNPSHFLLLYAFPVPSSSSFRFLDFSGISRSLPLLLSSSPASSIPSQTSPFPSPS